MAKLIYMIQTSLDGFIEDAEGKFGWSIPSPEVHQYINDLQRSVGTHLYGRRLYETMAVWEDMEIGDGFEDLEAQGRDFQQIWKATDKIVYSASLEKVWTPRTELKREFVAEEVRALKDSADADLVIGGAELAASALAAGLIDEVNTTISPVLIGSGKPAFPTDQKVELELLSKHRFENGAVHLNYRVS
jgi:dihydrofolate reductase